MMSRAVKDVACALLTVVITLGVIFMPYFYYDRADGNNFKNYDTETFNLDLNKDNIDNLDAFLKLASDENSVWVKDSKKIDDKDKSLIVESSVKQLQSCLPTESYGYKFLSEYLSDISELYYSNFTPVMISGVLDDNPVSVSVIYVESYSDTLWLQGVLDRESGVFYTLNLLSGVSDDGSGDYEIQNFADDETGECIKKYIGLGEADSIEFGLLSNELSFSALGYSSYDIVTMFENMGIFPGVSYGDAIASEGVPEE